MVTMDKRFPEWMSLKMKLHEKNDKAPDVLATGNYLQKVGQRAIFNNSNNYARQRGNMVCVI